MLLLARLVKQLIHICLGGAFNLFTDILTEILKVICAC
ncbi:hypothetical protein KL86PLE_90520 [uncultured Pleomorphomonas sp.]|uniref:Uncharacterized protein n=1 Tax=uncultured Pleomorphomonas sp. TaxID=442121 RepID=A0A212LPY8_9HYPH|nr:hypothetical protein KL86PLE_90520 [uncultured Pleomorphomonas sp.]